MIRPFRVAFAAALLASIALPVSSAWAQSAEQLSVRITQMEDQMRQLYGQIEELSHQVRTLQAQIARMGGQSGSAGETFQAPAQKPQKPKKAASVAEPASQGMEQIEDPAMGFQGSNQVTTIVTEDGEVVQKAPGPKILGTLPGSASDEFEGQVLVPPAGESFDGNEVETVSLGAQPAETPDVLYERSYESLLRRQFADAETGFRSFLQRHGDHSLAGNAQYWLGETYYVQGDYRQAAQSFLKGYKEFPKSRKAADSLLKLGLSLNRLGQKEQACAAFLQVGGQFPKAAETRKRAQSEAKRAGC
jgi:tol-pal system protein YbgF